MRIALALEYDGRSFCGWQSQPSACAVQDALEQALSQIAGHTIRAITAGRTDTGVHASSQIIHFDTQATRPITAWVRGVNALLPETIAVLWAVPVAPEFHARFSALSRSYRYLLLTHPVRPALLAGRVGWHHALLNLDNMRQAAAYLIGSHDFSAFRAAQCQAKSPMRDVQKIDIIQHGDLIVFEICANAFLHHMVRNIIGSLIYVGNGKQPAVWMQTLLQQRNRTLAAPTFAADGLYLIDILYDAKWGLPQRSRSLGFDFLK